MLIDHIDHIAKIAGIDHVGLGSDFDGIPSSPEGMDSAADLPKITQALMARGYSAEDMNKILGGNFLRVFAGCRRFPSNSNPRAGRALLRSSPSTRSRPGSNSPTCSLGWNDP